MAQLQVAIVALLSLYSFSGIVSPAHAQAQNVAAKNDLVQIALFYHLFFADQARFPRTQNEFKAYIKKDAPKLVKALDDGVYVLVLTKGPTSTRVLAYEKKPNNKGIHAVVMGDKSASSMTSKELEKALKKTD
jgi:hypothetical protein